MNVLSCFDGISCGQIALNRAGIKYKNYYASEIDKYAIKVTQENYPDTIQLGDIRKWKEWKLPKIDLLLAGSPCQGFSFAGKQLNFDDPRSKLFFKFVDILKHFKPKYFLLENVKMKKEYQDKISELVGYEPVLIDSALVSAQSRKRLYWSNLKITQPTDKNILLKDIVHENNNEVLDIEIQNFNINPSGKGMNGDVYSILKNKSRTLTTNKGEGQKISVCIKEYIVPFNDTLQILEKKCKVEKSAILEKIARQIEFIILIIRLLL